MGEIAGRASNQERKGKCQRSENVTFIREGGGVSSRQKMWTGKRRAINFRELFFEVFEVYDDPLWLFLLSSSCFFWSRCHRSRKRGKRCEMTRRKNNKLIITTFMGRGKTISLLPNLQKGTQIFAFFRSTKPENRFRRRRRNAICGKSDLRNQISMMAFLRQVCFWHRPPFSLLGRTWNAKLPATHTSAGFLPSVPEKKCGRR